MTSTKTIPTILKTDTRGRVRTPPDQREALMALFDQSAMSGAAFARLHGIRYTTLSHWRRMRRRKEEGSTTPHSPVLFHEVVVGSVPQARDGIEVNLPLGARVQLNGPEQIPLVAALARHLREAERC
ncbi:MAG: IS66 family insertion sequence element accessory protein TnpB [Kiritimatiellae bacterium]|nr:IS66 family insertion sequence element accessory protein TnpB [Kiritimatiellia bacterium]MCB1101120.1 IS66 family insertion sequence element accessory protein TnpB [Kiritimatiellia bacterium]